jgi:hypothetical protein
MTIDIFFLLYRFNAINRSAMALIEGLSPSRPRTRIRVSKPSSDCEVRWAEVRDFMPPATRPRSITHDLLASQRKLVGNGETLAMPEPTTTVSAVTFFYSCGASATETSIQSDRVRSSEAFMARLPGTTTSSQPSGGSLTSKPGRDRYGSINPAHDRPVRIGRQNGCVCHGTRL